MLVLAAGCRIGFDPMDCHPGAVFCDDFERTVPIPSSPTPWETVNCDDPMATLAVDGRLAIDTPASASALPCELTSAPTIEGSRFQLAFDFEVESGLDGDFVIVAELDMRLPAPNAAGIQRELIQLLVTPDRQANLSLVHFYPDESRSPNGMSFPGYDLADSDGAPWLSGPCRVMIDVDTISGRAEVLGACDDGLRALTRRDFSRPTGIAGSPVVSFGLYDLDPPSVRWSLRYDNVEFRADP